MEPMAVLETERLVLKGFAPEDAEELYAYAKDPIVGPPAGWKPHESVEESREIIATVFASGNQWAIRRKDDGRLIGSIGLEPDKHRPGCNSRELGYSLASDQWGQGLMPEAAEAVLQYGFETLDLDLVGICTGPSNRRSQGVIRKLGFVYEGTLRHCYNAVDGIRDSLIFSMNKKEYEGR